ncbi:uncharacterized protein HMPREF1541_08475 [Cyphellophora europaea CBS 101466]|uniref:Leptomycin B resistance protein pmd1 n=1 Tax=Cyphellophora europaea (strain CBS 101466) TaxID=1220924 RepID=W2RKE6_CYPE1|nr:uncharacterized protein HMPREF1541_08475 [Cyphellophora europaea CBS 101466]ETN36198.1 hypothetical protein HMPREF1541_08475 [Cyphellophora europaea CBS 101466]
MAPIPNYIKGVFGWFRLLLYAQPPLQDVALLFCGTVTAIASGTPVPILGIIFGQLMDDLNSATCEASDSSLFTRDTLRASINNKVLTVVYIAIGNLVLIYVYIVSWNLFGERLAQRVREKYLRDMLSKDIAFFDHVSPGEMANNLDADVNAIKQGTSQKVGVVINAISFFIAAYTIAFIKNARLGGILVSLTPAFLLMALVGGHFIGRFTGAMSTSVASASNIAFEALSNITLVRAYSADGKLADRFATFLAAAKSAGTHKAITASVQAGMLFFIAYSANATAYYVGSRQIADGVENDGGITVGTIYTVIFILVDATIILSTVAPFLQLFGAAQSALEKLEKNMDTGSTVDGRQTLQVTDRDTPLLRFSGVSFAYPSQPSVQVLRDLTLSIPAGKSTAVIGPSGSGKSTIASLALGMYRPSTGEVWLGNGLMRDLSITSARGLMSFVQQDATLFDRSILENIALGLINSPQHRHLNQVLLSDKLAAIAARVREGVDIFQAAKDAGGQCTEIIELVVDAAGQADADAFIQNLQDGYGTTVGSKGALISGGQKQRIALARALVKNPEILILDEATASLDSASEQRVQQALVAASRGRTTLTIAHRLSTIRDADNIVVMRSGQIVEQGTHAGLMAAGGFYLELVQLQQNTDKSERHNNHLDDAIHEQLDDVGPKENSDGAAQGSPAQPSKLPSAAGSDPEIEAKRSISYVLNTLGPMLRPSAMVLVVAFTAMLIVGGTYSASALILGNTIGRLSPCNGSEAIRSSGRFFALMFFILAIIELLANIISWSGFGLASERFLRNIRLRAFKSLLNQDQGWHESFNRTPKSLLSLITADCNAIGGLTGSTIGTILSILVNMVAAIILTHLVAWKIALVCLAVVPLIMGTGAMHMIALARFAARHSQAFKNSIGIAVEAVESIKTVAALSLEEEILQTYRRSLKAPTKEMTKQSAYSYMWLALAYGLPTFLFSLSFWWGSSLVLTGEYTQVDYYICTIALLVSAQLWGQLFTIAPDVSKAFEAVRRVVNLFDLDSSKEGQVRGDSPSAGEKSLSPLKDAGASIVLEDVHFAYPARPQVEVLKGLSLSIRPGQFCALVGPSGAGKSTVFTMLERMHRPESGNITIDDRDIGSSDVTFRNTISYVPQDSVLFDGSVRFNLELGATPDQKITDAELAEACQLANIHDKIMSLPEGYDSNCGSGGCQLSGGEKQRLAVARALIRKPRLLLLDESTSALDAHNEKALENGLSNARRATGMTVVAIAHRLSTIKNADIIFVIDGGRVIDSGRHEELLARCDMYRVNASHQGF